MIIPSLICHQLEFKLSLVVSAGGIQIIIHDSPGEQEVKVLPVLNMIRIWVHALSLRGATTIIS